MLTPWFCAPARLCDPPVAACCGVDSHLVFPVDRPSVQFDGRRITRMTKLIKRYHSERHYMRDLAQSGSRSTAVELIGLVPSRMTTAVTDIHSRGSSSSFCEAGALRRSCLTMNTLAKCSSPCCCSPCGGGNIKTRERPLAISLDNGVVRGRGSGAKQRSAMSALGH